MHIEINYITAAKEIDVMVTTTEILPCPALQSYVRCYTLREFDTMGADFMKPLPANHEFTIAFTLSGALSAGDTNYKDIISGSRKHIIGLQTAFNGSVIFNGYVRLFTIQFKPNGFYKLFNIPLNLLTDHIYKASDIMNKNMTIYNEQLNEAKDLTTMKNCTDELLLSHLISSKANDPYNGITSASALIFRNPFTVNIKRLAYEANMSMRSFELKFTRQVGLPPKLFARITRFNYALLMKIQDSSKNWTDISHKCGYYDQMHFIKEFKQFAGDTPVNFYKETPLPEENYIQVRS